MANNEDQSNKMEISESFLKRLNMIRGLPTLPVIVQRLGTEIRNPASDARKISKIVEDDPAMMARILRVVNSAFYSGTEPVTSIHLAVARMGMRAVGNIAMSTAVFSAFKKSKVEDFNREEFWRHSICTGIAAGVLYERVRKSVSVRLGTDILHLAGLLHDIGRIVFDQFFHAEFLEAVKKGQADGVTVLDAEKQAIGEGHDVVGAWLGLKWNLSDELNQVIRFHHDPDKADEKHWYIAGLVHVANYICNLGKIGCSGDYFPQVIQPVWTKFGLSVGDIPEVVDQVKEASKKSEILMTIARSD